VLLWPRHWVCPEPMTMVQVRNLFVLGHQGFTSMSEQVEPLRTLMLYLRLILFSAYDALARKWGIYKGAVGDACGLHGS
jgi:hypothetical protein